MAFPENVRSIKTNVPHWQLLKIIKALELKQVVWLEGGSLIGCECSGFFRYKRHRYKIFEIFEIVDSITRVDEDDNEIKEGINMAEFAESAIVEHKLKGDQEAVNAVIKDMFYGELSEYKKTLESILEDVEAEMEVKQEARNMKDWVTK